MASTDYLPGFSHHLHGRPSGAKHKDLTRQAAKLDGLAALVARFLPVGAFEPPPGSRKRIYTPWVTFVAFLGQVLTRGSSCREAVRRVQSWFVAERRTAPDESTSAYCQARARLTVESLREGGRTGSMRYALLSAPPEPIAQPRGARCWARKASMRE